MKSKLLLSILFQILLSFFFCPAGNSQSNPGMVHELEGWSGNQNFWFAREANTYQVCMNKNPWESISIQMTGFDWANQDQILLQIKSPEKLNIRVLLVGSQTAIENDQAIELQTAGTGEFETLSIDITGLAHNFSQETAPFLILWVNPGMSFKGEVFIQEFRKSASEKNAQSVSSSGITNQPVVFPNPAHDSFQVEIPGNEFHTFVLYDLGGKEIKKMQVNSADPALLQVDISGQPAGTYVVSLIGTDEILTSRLMID